jgi:SAM-dependent methyltransferase
LRILHLTLLAKKLGKNKLLSVFLYIESAASNTLVNKKAISKIQQPAHLSFYELSYLRLYIFAQLKQAVRLNVRNMILSPITNNAAQKVLELDSAKIIQLYLKDDGLDVNRYFKETPFISIYKCTETGYRFYSPKSAMGDDIFYGELSGNGDYTRPWAFDHQIAFDRINKDEHILEIGCGNGEFLLKALSKTPNVTGIELNDKMVDICKNKGLNVVNELLEAHKINNAGKYDMICAFQVLEHIYDVRQFLEDIIFCLKPGGKILLSTPNNDEFYMEYDKYATKNLPPHHIGIWNAEAYKGVAKYLGLKVSNIQYTPAPSFKGVVFQKAISVLNYNYSKKSPLFYLALIYSVAYCSIKRLFKKYSGCYMVVEMSL